MEGETNRWGTLIRLEGPDCHYGFPFRRVTNDFKDTLLTNAIQGSMCLPDGTHVRARRSESYVYATQDPRLRAALKMDQDAFANAYCLARGVITHDGLPFLLPIEMQAAVFAVILTAWELEMDRRGDLTSYALRTKHAAIRGCNLYLRQSDRVLVAESLFLGHGSCNEAEYLALLNGLRITRALFPNPGMPVIAQSDSQLVVHQVQGLWKAKDRMKDFCRTLMALRTEYPYELVQVPREENQNADSLAQEVVLKHSGRALSLEHGRFDVSKAALGKGNKRNRYQDLTTREFRTHIEQFNLRGNFARLRILIEEGRRAEAAALVNEIMDRAQWVLANAPLSNSRIEQWVRDTVGIIRASLTEINKCVEKWDVDGIKYYLDEMAGQPSDTEGGEIWQAAQIQPPQDGMGLGPLLRLSGDEGLCDD
jgi:ribonuclease HI